MNGFRIQMHYLSESECTALKNVPNFHCPPTRHFYVNLDLCYQNNVFSKYKGNYVISYKLDGISALLYKNNNNIYLYTRGDGKEGQDISHLLKYLKLNTSKLNNNDAIRGELIISKENFKYFRK